MINDKSGRISLMSVNNGRRLGAGVEDRNPDCCNSGDITMDLISGCDLKKKIIYLMSILRQYSINLLYKHRGIK